MKMGTFVRLLAAEALLSGLSFLTVVPSAQAAPTFSQQAILFNQPTYADYLNVKYERCYCHRPVHHARRRALRDDRILEVVEPNAVIEVPYGYDRLAARYDYGYDYEPYWGYGDYPYWNYGYGYRRHHWGARGWRGGYGGWHGGRGWGGGHRWGGGHGWGGHFGGGHR